LYGSSGFLPEAHRHSYDPMVLWHFVCPLQWCPYLPPLTKHSSTSEKNKILVLIMSRPSCYKIDCVLFNIWHKIFHAFSGRSCQK
jgi:hypothetical protein